MKLAVIADIHSNYLALEAALAAFTELKPDKVLFLGDYLTDCPYPQRTVELLKQCQKTYPTFMIRGNREDYLIAHREHQSDSWAYHSATGSLLYTYENLSHEDLDFFSSMPIWKDLAFPGCPAITACHGSPQRTNELLLGDPALIERYAKEIRGELLLCGHVHQSAVIRSGGKDVVFCPSLGLPQDEIPSARFLMLYAQNGPWTYQEIAVEYDKESLIQAFRESGLLRKANVWAKCIVRSIREAHNYPMRCVTRAWEIAKDNCFDGASELPDCYWEAAAIELGVMQKPPTLREYRSEDCQGMAELFYGAVHTCTAKDYTPEQRSAWADGKVDLKKWNASFLKHFTLVAERDGKIIGFADLDDTGYLDRLYVHKNHQGEGIASKLCDYLEKKFPGPLITTHASITAKPFFEKRGYTLVREQLVKRKGVLLTNYVMVLERGSSA